MGSSVKTDKDDEIDAIKAKTDLIPADPATETNVNANEAKIDIAIADIGTVDGKVDAIDANVDSVLEDTNETQGKLPSATIAGEAEATVNKLAVIAEIDENEVKIDALVAQNDTTFIGD